MVYDEVKISHADELREKIMELYGRDLKDAQCYFSTRNYVFVFSKGCKPVVLRVSVNTTRTRQDVLSEAVWVDDLRNTIPNIAHMVPSEHHSIVEEFTIGEDHFCVTQFRKANGDVAVGEDRDERYFYEAGKLLGKIHKASREEQLAGFQFHRCKWYEKVSCDCTAAEASLPKETIDFMKEWIETMKQIPTSAENFGMVHGDYQPNNMFLDWDKLWVFDFDDCNYGYYMMDIADFMHLASSDARYQPEKNRVEVFDEILKIFREGYETENRLEEAEWAKMDDFLRLRVCEVINLLAQIETIPKDIRNYLIASQATCLDLSKSFKELTEIRFREGQKNKRLTAKTLYGSEDRARKQE